MAFLVSDKVSLVLKRVHSFSRAQMELDPKEPRIEKIKKLGSSLEDGEDINNRKRLSWMAMAKYNDIWKNPYIKIPQKIAIYNTYVRSVLVYNASTWVSNVTINNQINIIH